MKPRLQRMTFSVYMLGMLFCFSMTGFSQNSTINICDYGADNTGLVSSSEIINHVIDSLSHQHGGTIYFPAGEYTCGPIILKSNISLLTDAGAVIHFSDNFDEYLPMVTSRWEGIRVKTFISPLYAIDAENVSIKGQGHFDGNGKKWWDYMYSARKNGITDSKWQTIFQSENEALLKKNSYLKKMNNFLRPPMVMFYNCKNILIEGVSFSNPPFWTIVPVFSDNVTIQNITINNPDNSPNTDGIDPSSSKNIHISNCHISVGDDCIVLKSGRDEDGRDAGMPTENVTITNCTMLNGHGGVVIGSEMSGDIRRVTISNCVFEGTDRGIRIKTLRGRGGVVEDIMVSNITMHDIVREGIMINMRYQKTPVEELSEKTPLFRRLHFSNINIAEAEQGIAIYGLEERSVDGVSFSDIYMQANKGITGQYARNLTFDNIRLETPAETSILFDKCNNVSVNGLQLLKPSEKSTIMQLDDCRNFKISNCFQPELVDTFLRFNDKCQYIYLTNNILIGIKNILNSPEEGKIILMNNIIQ